MSTCISREGEYSDHTPSDEEFTCGRCGADDWTAALSEIARLRGLVAEERAAAWDEGHRTYQKLGPDGCRCGAWNDSECGCGLYGSNVITPNPYRTTETEGAK